MCGREEPKQRKEQGLWPYQVSGFLMETPNIRWPSSWRGLQELTKILCCFCHRSEREMLAQQRKDSNLLQPSWADEPRNLEPFHKTPRALMCRVSGRSTRFERKKSSVTSDGHHLPQSTCGRETLVGPCRPRTVSMVSCLSRSRWPSETA